MHAKSGQQHDKFTETSILSSQDVGLSTMNGTGMVDVEIEALAGNAIFALLRDLGRFAERIKS